MESTCVGVIGGSDQDNYNANRHTCQDCGHVVPRKEPQSIRRLYKYTFGENWQAVLPPESVPRHVAMQRGKLCVWAEVPTRPTDTKPVYVISVPTGGGINVPEWRHIGTVLMEDGEIVLHCYTDGGFA
jgi:hypothetical protein